MEVPQTTIRKDMKRRERGRRGLFFVDWILYSIYWTGENSSTTSFPLLRPSFWIVVSIALMDGKAVQIGRMTPRMIAKRMDRKLIVNETESWRRELIMWVKIRPSPYSTAKSVRYIAHEQSDPCWKKRVCNYLNKDDHARIKDQSKQDTMVDERLPMWIIVL